MDHGELQAVIASGVAAVGPNLWHLEFNEIKAGFEFIVTIDAQHLDAEVCADVARHLKVLLGAEGYPQEKIFIDVCSPGLNRRLYSLQHCQDYLGSTVKCSFADSGYLIGVLTAVNDEDLALKLTQGTLFNIKIKEIQQIHLQENYR